MREICPEIGIDSGMIGELQSWRVGGEMFFVGSWSPIIASEILSRPMSLSLKTDNFKH